MPRPPRFVGILGIAHVGVFGHVGGIGVARLRGALGQLVGGHLGLLERHPFGVFGFLGLAFAGCVVLATVLIAALFVLVLPLAAAIVAHVERVEQIVDAVGGAPLVGDEFLQAVEVAAGAVLDPRAPKLDQLARGGRRRAPGEALAHQEGEGIFDRRIGAIGDL